MTVETIHFEPLGDMEFLYRYEDRVRVSGYSDEWDNYHVTSRKTEVYLRKFEIIRRTRKGAWIEWDQPEGKRFILLSARKRFACDNELDALESFVARKAAQSRILAGQLKRAGEARLIGQVMLTKKQKETEP